MFRDDKYKNSIMSNSSSNGANNYDFFNSLYEKTFNKIKDEEDDEEFDLLSKLDSLAIKTEDYDDVFSSMYKKAESELGISKEKYVNQPYNQTEKLYAEKIANNKLLAPGKTQDVPANKDGEKKPLHKSIPILSDAIGGAISGLGGAGKTFGEWDYKIDIGKANSYKEKAEKAKAKGDNEKAEKYMKKYEEKLASAEYWRQNSSDTADKMINYGNSYSTVDEEAGMLEKATKGAVGSLANMAVGTVIGGGQPLVGMGLTTYGQGKKEAQDLNLSDEDANRFAISNALIETGSELLLPGAKGLKSFLTTGSLKTAIKEAGKEGVGGFLKEISKEFGQEGLTEVANIANEFRFKDKDGNSIAVNGGDFSSLEAGLKTIMEAGERTLTAGLSGAIMGGLTQGGTNVANYGQGTSSNTQQAQQQEQQELKGFLNDETSAENNVDNSSPETVINTGSKAVDDINNALGFNALEEADLQPVNPDAPYIEKTINENGQEVYITEDGNTVNARLAEMVAEQNGTPIESLAKFTPEQAEIRRVNQEADTTIQAIETSIQEQGVETTIKTLENSLKNGEITQEVFNTATEYVNAIANETQQETAQVNPTQQDLTQNNTTTPDIAQNKAINNNISQQVLTGVNTNQHKLTQSNTKNTSSETNINVDANNIIEGQQSDADIALNKEEKRQYEEKVKKLDKVVNTKAFKANYPTLKTEVVAKLNVEQQGVNELAKAMSKDVVFFKGDSKNAPNGFMKDNTIFLNGDFKGDAMVQVLGHETFHTLKETDTETFNKLVDWGMDNFSTREINKFLAKINNEAEVNKLRNNPKLLSEEMLAEAFGNDFANKEFWASMEKTNKTLFDKVKEVIAKIFKDAEAKTTDFLTKKHIKELRGEFENIFGDLTNNSLYGEFASNDVAKSLQDTVKEEAKASKKKNLLKTETSVDEKGVERITYFRSKEVAKHEDNIRELNDAIGGYIGVGFNKDANVSIDDLRNTGKKVLGAIANEVKATDFNVKVKENKITGVQIILTGELANGQTLKLTTADMGTTVNYYVNDEHLGYLPFFNFRKTDIIADFKDAVNEAISQNSKPENGDDVKFATRKGKEFDEWFKGSVMTKADGTPQLFYHTTNAIFDDFDDNAKTINGKRYGAGHYFTDKRPQPGYGYGKNRLSVNLKIENPLDFSKKIDIDKAKNIARDLDKEFGTTKYGEYRTEKLEKTIKSFGENGEIPVSFFSGAIQIENSDYRDILREYGYDGIIEYSGGEHYVVAFSNDQVNVKSRVDENGIRFSTRTKEEIDKITAPLYKVKDKTNDIQLRAGIHKLQGVKVDTNINLTDVFEEAIRTMSGNTDSVNVNAKKFTKTLKGQGIEAKQANAIAKYFANVVEASKINVMESTPKAKNVITSSSYKAKNKGGIKKQAGEAFDKFYTRIVDSTNAGKLVNDIFYTKARISKNSFSIAEHIMVDGLVDKNGKTVGKSIKELFADTIPEGKEIQFMEYALHKHNISRALQGKYVFFKEDGTPIHSNESAKIVKEMEAKNPDFASRQAELTGWINQFMKVWAVDTGLMSEDMHSMLKEMYNHYVPTNRSFQDHEELFGGGYGGKGFVDKSKPTKMAQKGGSARDIIDLQESIVNLATKTVRTAKMNEVGQELVKAVRQNPAMSNLASIVAKPDTNVDNVVRVLENGEPVYVEIHDKQLLEMVEQIHSPEYGAITEVVKRFNGGVKALITSKNPLFAITNTLRDYQTYMVNSTEPNVFKRWGNIGKAINLIAKDLKQQDISNTEYGLYKAMGIGGSGIMAKDNGKTVSNITGKKAIINKQTGAIEGYKEFGKIKKGWNKFNEGLEILTGSTETTFRLAEFLGAIDRGDSVEDATLKAMEITVDFARGGDITKQADAYVKYLNAGVQGLDRFARQVKNHPVQTLTRSIVHIAAPALILTAFNAGDDEYEMLDDRTKDNNFLIPLKLFGGEEGQYLKLPKAREYGMVAMLAERLIYGRGFENFGRTVSENMLPPSVISDNIIFDLARATMEDPKDFAGRSIIPKELQQYEAREQYDDNTTVVAKWLGQLTGMSPKKIDYYLDGYTGIIGDTLQPLLMPSTYAVEGDEVSKILAPFKKKFVADNAYSSGASSSYYDGLDKLQKIINAEHRDMSTAGMEGYKTETEAFKKYINDSYGKDITDMGKILKDKSLTEAEKRQLRQYRNNAMKIANEEIKLFLSPKNR